MYTVPPPPPLVLTRILFIQAELVTGRQYFLQIILCQKHINILHKSYNYSQIIHYGDKYSTVPTPLLTMSRDPDASVTLRHGDHLNLTCTIELDQAVDIDVTVTGTLSEKGILNPIFDAVKNVSSNVYQINRTIASLKAARSTVYSCNATVSPGPGVANVTSSGQTYSMLNITVGKLVTGLLFKSRKI